MCPTCPCFLIDNIYSAEGFFPGMWSNGRHFRVAARDEGKSTCDSFISAFFNVGLPEKEEFIGQIHQIMRLNYDSVKVVVLKCKWYDNNVKPWRASTSLVDDECGIQRVKTKEFLNDHLWTHEPFVFPSQCNQVFLIPDRLHRHWHLVVDTEVRRERPSIPRRIPPVTNAGEAGPSREAGTGTPEETVDSASDVEDEERNHPGRGGEEIYREELLTYRRRPKTRTAIELENQQLDHHVEEEILSEDEYAPEVEDFPIIES
jgi:hypothetical protein